VSFLLTGDIFEEADREILHHGGVLRSTVLKVAHHGSATSTSSQFLAAVDPQIAVICVGKDNLFGLPHQNTLDKLEEKLGEDKIYLTSEHGTITFITNGERLWVETGK
jgi:competence protein ComEC